jgi:antitoxin (DNA-binding transcriptional repressor) of toxin-antitoxin stability system
MAVFNMHQAKTGLSRLVALAEAGEEVVIARHNIAVAKLVPVSAPLGKGGKTDAASGFGEEAQMEFIATGDNPAKFASAVSAKARKPGALKGMFSLPDTFFDPLPEEELQAWEGAFSFDPDRKP